MAGDPKNQPDYEALVKSLNTKKGRLLKCGVQQDSLSVYAVVETNGSVRAAAGPSARKPAGGDGAAAAPAVTPMAVCPAATAPDVPARADWLTVAGV